MASTVSPLSGSLNSSSLRPMPGFLCHFGGVLEETCILGVPCVTLQENTERPETILVGSTILVGTDPDRIRKAIHEMLQPRAKWSNPFCDGKAGKKIGCVRTSAKIIRSCGWKRDTYTRPILVLIC